MRHPLFTAALIVSGLALTGCGQSTCEKLISGYESLRDKYGDCPSETETLFLNQAIEEEQANCEDEYEAASDEEKAALDATAENFDRCVSELDDCSEENEDTFATEASACFVAAEWEN